MGDAVAVTAAKASTGRDHGDNILDEVSGGRLYEMEGLALLGSCCAG